MYCGGHQVKRNGHYASGRQRWFCHDCQKSFCWQRPGNKKIKERIWFERWIVEGYSVRQLCQHSGHSSAKLYRIIDYWLEHPPHTETDLLEGIDCLILDGTFLYRPKSIVTIMDARTNAVINGVYGISENSESQLMTFLISLKEKGLSPTSCTIDGNPQVKRVLKKLWPDVIIQRCLVHIQRQGLSWCRMYSKTNYARDLRNIFRQVTYIKTKQERNSFINCVKQWEERYGKYIAKRPEKGRVFSDIKRARSMLLRALPDMFHYLDDPNIPSTTNGLEGYFSRLKGHYRQHRGLSQNKRKNYFNWYFFLRPR